MALTERLAILLETVGAGAVVRDFDRVSRASRTLGSEAKSGTKGLDALSASGLASSAALKAGVAGAALLAAGKLANFGKAAIDAASALQEQMSGATVTFGDATDVVIEFAEESAASLGLAKSEALAAANAFGGFFKSAGATPQSAAEASTSLVQLAGDLASFKDVVGGVPAVLEKLRSGLAGETEPLRSLGVFLNEAAVRAKAAQLGLGAVGRQLTDGEKIAARYALIIEQTADAQGDMARTSGSLANQQRKLRGDIESLKEEVGGGLVPAAKIAVSWFRSLVGGARAVGGAVADASTGFGLLTEKMEGTEEIPERLREKWKHLIGDAKTFAEANREIDKILIGSEPVDEAAAAEAKLAKNLEIQARAQQESAEATEETTKAVLAASSAQRAYDAAVRDVIAAERDVTDARREYNQLLKEGAVDEEKVADARRSLNDATRSLGSAQRNLRDAQEEYNEALANFTRFGGDTAADKLADASDDLADAQDSVASAQERQQEAAEELKRAQAGDPDFNDKLAAAKLRVKEAEQGLADAQYNSAQQAFELDEALRTQNTTLAQYGSAVNNVYNEWDALLKRKPEIAAFLAGPMGALPQPAASAAGVPGPGFGLRQYETAPTPTAGGLLGVPLAQTRPSVVFNNTFNTPVNSSQLARDLIWNMTGNLN